ncbi:hypothetical protein [Tissierella praeacuta]|jgi:PHP family Zn ribbon phosphoesterase|uniref:hypothetical protein n=1 Tax=Tissierella praeacuta TaxID=43131 RepID=UPI0028AA54D8|nr:hypothetical protein [Tissierella praeacuta]
MKASNKERIHVIANRMGLEFTEDKDSNLLSSRMLNISKPGRPDVKESSQRQLEIVAGIRKK